MPEESVRPDRWVGAGVPRLEDHRFTTGSASYLDDLALSGMLHVSLVRTPFAHARIGAIDASAASALEGVVGVVTAADIDAETEPFPIAAAEGCDVAPVPLPILARDAVRFVGQPVAAVLAERRAIAEDAAELVVIDYEPLPTVVDPSDSSRDHVRIHHDVADNVLVRWERQGGDVDAAFAAADTIVQQRFHIPRLVAAPIEPRGALATYNADDDVLTVWLSSQDPHRPLANVTRVLRRSAERTRVIVPDVGGAFGSKGPLAPEAALTALLAIRTGRPVKWVETRTENFLAAYQGRGLDADVELAATTDGRILAVRARLVADMGAYLQPTSTVPPTTTAMLLTGTYAVPVARVELLGMATNKVPVGPYRGAGRPEAAIVLERMIDLLSDEVGIDRVELRRRNLIPPDAFPYRTPLGFVYDSGDYARALDAVCERVGEREGMASDDRSLRGTGIAMYVERAGGGAAAGPGGLRESASISVEPGGRIVLRSGASAHGQGHETTFAQIVADVFGVRPDDVEVRGGDSAEVPEGVGTFGSRSVTIAGSAAMIAAERARDRAAAVGAAMLEVAAEDVEWSGGSARVRGAPERSVSLAEVAAAVSSDRPSPYRLRDGIREEATFTLPGPVFPSGACGAEVEIDVDTGVVRVLRIVAVDDAGRIVNPLLAHGQVHGGAVQGLGQSLTEEVVHDEEAQPLAASFVSYAVLSAADVPPIESIGIETPSPFNALGAKGIGEAGAIGTPAAVANAVCRALAPLGIRHLDLPFTPERVLHAIRHARDGG